MKSMKLFVAFAALALSAPAVAAKSDLKVTAHTASANSFGCGSFGTT